MQKENRAWATAVGAQGISRSAREPVRPCAESKVKKEVGPHRSEGDKTIIVHMSKLT